MDKPDLIRHIAKGQQHILASDYEPLLADINDEMKHLTLDTLTELYEHVKFLRTRQQVLSESPKSDEAPMPVDVGHARRTAPHGQAGPFDGKLANPMPLETDTENMCFDSLIKWAIKLDVPERHDEWLDDEWPDKEDALRVAVAEAMEKVGK